MSTSVAKLTFDLLPEHPSCRVTGLSSSLMDSFTIHMKSGLMVSIILPESNSVYALTPFISTYAVRHKSLLSSLMGLVIRPTGLTMWYWYAQGDSSASVITQIDTLLVSVWHLMTVCVYMALLPHCTSRVQWLQASHNNCVGTGYPVSSQNLYGSFTASCLIQSQS